MKTERLTRSELYVVINENRFIPRANVAQMDRIGALYDAGAPATVIGMVIGMVIYALCGRGDVYGDEVSKAIRAAEKRKTRPEVSQATLKVVLANAGYSDAAVDAVALAVRTSPAAGKAYHLTA